MRLRRLCQHMAVQLLRDVSVRRLTALLKSMMCSKSEVKVGEDECMMEE